MPFDREMFEYEFLYKEPAMGVAVEATFTERPAIATFKARVEGVALKYTAFYPGAAGNIFMLGWDHAMLIERVEGTHFVREIYASGDSATTSDVSVFDLRGEARQKLEHPTIVKVKGKDWRKYDVSELNLAIEKLVTFSITSCSFACLWPDDRKLFLVSHVAFAPPIPLFTMFKNYEAAISLESAVPRHEEAVLVTRKPHLNLFASLNTTDDELNKYTADGLADANDYDVTAKYLLRGPYKCHGLGNDAPYKTHPYVTLNFGAEGVYYGGALGFNNDPTMPVEMPPFHSTIGSALRPFNAMASAKAILEKEKELLDDQYGFMRLHFAMLTQVLAADMADVDSWVPYHSKYKSEAVNRLIQETTAQPLADDPILQDPFIQGRERAIFLLAELTTRPNEPRFKLAFDAVMTAWRKEQMSFSFLIHLIHAQRDELEGLVPVVLD